MTQEKWTLENGVIRLNQPLVSDGTTGEEWIGRLERKNFRVGGHGKRVLSSSDFRPTDGVTYRVAVLPGSLFADAYRTTRKIRAEAKRRGLAKPTAEVDCLIRESLSDEDLEAMGFWWIATMHEPIDPKDSGDSGPLLLDTFRCRGGRWLGGGYDKPGVRWHYDGGFAFVEEQAGA